MTDRLAQIFAQKRISSDKFREVQRKNGLLLAPENLRADPATREGAMELHKGIHWINLELAEFLNAPRKDKLEEIADVLHFLLELAILFGYDETIIPAHAEDGKDRLDNLLEASQGDAFVFQDADTNARFTILAGLLVADTLKNKPWKQTLKPAPTPEVLKALMEGLFYWYGATVRTSEFTAEQLFDAFVAKDTVNHNRVDTGV